MQLQKASRKKVKLRLNLASPSGFGKTYGALLIAYGITNNWEKIAVIDTEHDSASLYSHLGNYNTISLSPPYTPDRYIEAIKVCENANMDVIIIDSITHVWKGEGGLLEYQNALGGRYQDWAKATPLYTKWLNAILNSKCHIITTNRKKQGYAMVSDGNKTKVNKVGLEDEIRDGFDYEVTVALEIINDKHLAMASKDRTNLFAGKPDFVITTEVGKKLLDWCNSGISLKEEVIAAIGKCQNMPELVDLYNKHSSLQVELQKEFSAKKFALE
jgi:hypothetical protein